MTRRAIIMAAGHGTRMKSRLPKVLHPLCGRPMLAYPLRAAREAGAEQVVVVVNPATREAIENELSSHGDGLAIDFAVQEVPRGTGDAVKVGMSLIEAAPEDQIMILSGDTPLLEGRDLLPLCQAVDQGASLALAGFVVDDPTGYGRVLRDESGAVSEIREHRDLQNDEHRAVREVNAGLYVVRADALRAALPRLSAENAQHEYYLTDVVALIASDRRVVALTSSAERMAGVNDRAQLSANERLMFERIRHRLGQAGVSLVGEPLIDDTVRIEPGARIEHGVRLRGATTIAAEVVVDVGTVVDDCSVGAGSHIKAHCVLSQSSVGERVQLGPFAHLRPDSTIEDEAHLGNFVETKKTRVRRGAKANHLAYLGDADVGEGSNLGAGTIICNYDGFQKRRTTIGRGVFIGSDSQLVAPVTIGDGAYVATATTVTRDVPEDALAIGRTRQQNKLNYASRLRARLAAQAKQDG